MNAVADEVLQAQGLAKSYGGQQVVGDVSLTLRRGEVLGLIGPNGAGKTTTIRMMLRIIAPDAGRVLLFGRPLDQAALDRVGYLPEERGLYRNARVEEVLVYLGRLKGMEPAAARRRAQALLEELGMAPHAGKKVSELSRGMGQLVQVAAALVHSPEIVVLDEPFSGLDPVNVERLKELVESRRRAGAAVVFSTHQMSTVEELCQDVLMIDQGRVVLSGRVDAVRRRYRDNVLLLQWAGPRHRIVGVERWEERGGSAWLARLALGATPEDVLRQLIELGGAPERFELFSPSLHDIFIRVVGDGRQQAGARA